MKNRKEESPQALENLIDETAFEVFRELFGEPRRDRALKFLRQAFMHYHRRSEGNALDDTRDILDALKPDATKQRAMRQVQVLLDLAERILPRKITNEVIGDCYERIATDDAHHMLVQLDALCTVWWALVLTLKEFVKPGALIAALWKFLGS